MPKTKETKTFETQIQNATEGGTVLGELLASTRATLIAKGIREDEATEITKSVIQPMSSICDGECGA